MVPNPGPRGPSALHTLDKSKTHILQCWKASKNMFGKHCIKVYVNNQETSIGKFTVYTVSKINIQIWGSFQMTIERSFLGDIQYVDLFPGYICIHALHDRKHFSMNRVQNMIVFMLSSVHICQTFHAKKTIGYRKAKKKRI